MFVVTQAAPREVLQDGFASVLLGDDMVHLKRQRVERRGYSAVITPIAREDLEICQQGSFHDPRRFFAEGR
jgi:hypothetical protein